MKDKLWQIVFGEKSLLKQAYVQFFIALALFGLFFLPTRILIVATFLLSVWAIVISAQTFIAGAQANKKLLSFLDNIEDMLERLEKIQSDVKEVKAETVEATNVKANTVEANEINGA